MDAPRQPEAKSMIVTEPAPGPTLRLVDWRSERERQIAFILESVKSERDPKVAIAVRNCCVRAAAENPDKIAVINATLPLLADVDIGALYDACASDL